MAMSNTIKIALASAAGAIVTSSTILFPLIKDINKTISEENPVHTPTDAETNKSEQIITKEPATASNIQSSTAGIEENPSLPSNTVSSTNDPKMYSSDTVKSNILMEDIPHYKRN